MSDRSRDDASYDDAALAEERRELDELVGWKSDDPPAIRADLAEREVERVSAYYADDGVEVGAPSGWRARMPMLMAAASVMLLVSLGASYFSYSTYTENQARTAARNAEAQRLKEQAAAKQRELDARLDQIRRLEDQMASAVDPEELRRLKAKLRKAKSGAKLVHGGARRGKAPPKACAPGDPLCSELAAAGGARPVPAKTPQRPRPEKCAPGDPLCSDM